MSIQFKRGTADQRKINTLVLDKGQPFFETDTNKLYMGDGTTALKSLKPIVESSNNEFTGDNVFRGSSSFFNSAYFGSGATFSAVANATFGVKGTGYYLYQTDVTTNNTAQLILGGTTEDSTTTSYKVGTIVNKQATLTLPTTTGTLALTDDCFTYIDKTINSVIFTSTTTTFTADEMTQIYNNYSTTVIHLSSLESGASKPVEKFLYPYGKAQDTNFFIFVSPIYSNYQYVLTVSGSAGTTATATITKTSVGSSSSGGSGYATVAGDNTFTGSNTFKKALKLYTDTANGTSMSATLDSYKLKLFNDLGSVYADLNITDDTAPYLELKTAGHGKTKYTPESIIYTDTLGNQKTTTLKLPGQGATADSTQTIATLEASQTFTGTNVFGNENYGITIYSASTSGQVNIKGNNADSMQIDFYSNSIKFGDLRHHGGPITTLTANMATSYGTANATITLPSKTGTLMTNNDFTYSNNVLTINI